MDAQTDSGAALLQAARELGPSFAARSLEFEAAKCLPQDAAQAIRDAGFIGMSVPQAYGGTENSPLDIIKVIEELSYHDGAAGWVAMIYITSATISGLLDPKWAKEIYKPGPTPIIAGATAPTGKGVFTDQGVTATGRWGWGSGTNNCDWICGGTRVNTEVKEEGAPKVHLMYFKRDQVKLHNNWDPSGLAGTGSGDFSVENAKVPEDRWIILGRSGPKVDGPLYRFPYFGLFASAVCAVGVGIARRALDEFVTLAQDKVPAWQTKTIGTQSVTHVDFAKAEAAWESGRAFLHACIAENWDKVVAGDKPTLEDRRRLRLAASTAAEYSVRAVQAVYTAGGGSSVHRSHPLQRCLRDVNVVTQHRMTAPGIYPIAGGVKLGADYDTNMF